MKGIRLEKVIGVCLAEVVMFMDFNIYCSFFCGEVRYFFGVWFLNKFFLF